MSVEKSTFFRIRHWWAVLLFPVVALLASGAIAGVVTYTYDSLGRLTKADFGGGKVITYVYDAAGNRTSYVVTGLPN